MRVLIAKIESLPTPSAATCTILLTLDPPVSTPILDWTQDDILAADRIARRLLELPWDNSSAIEARTVGDTREYRVPERMLEMGGWRDIG